MKLRIDSATLSRVEKVERLDSLIFSDLVHVSGLSKKTDFSDSQYSEVDFSGSDLTGYIFDGSDLRGVIFDDTTKIDETTSFLNCRVDANFGEFIATSLASRSKADKRRKNLKRPRIFNLDDALSIAFQGRDEELRRLHGHLSKGETTAVTAVAGMGGIGKTTLAREYALRFGVAARYGGVWWVEAETEGQIIASFERLARRDGVAVEPSNDPRKVAAHVKEWLGAQVDAAPWLVIFDNAPDAATVRPFVPAGSARVIITSRNSSFSGLAEAMSLDQWDQATTVAYLERRIGRGSAAELSALAARIDGLPLAAEMAAAYLVENSALSVAAYEERLLRMMDERPEDMAGDYPDSVYGALSAAIAAVAERRQGEAALGILNICAFLAPEGVDLALLTATAEKTDFLPESPCSTLVDELTRAAALSVLSNYSLLHLEGNAEWGETLHLHLLIREIARARLGAAETRHWAGAAVRMVNGAFPYQVDDPSTWSLCARLTPHAEVLAGFDLGIDDDARAQDRLLNQAALYRDARGDRAGAVSLLRRSVEIKEQSRRDEPLSIATALDNLAGRLGEDEATWGEAEALYARALSIKLEELQASDPSLAITLSNFGAFHRRRKNFAEAVRLTEQAAEINKAASGELSAEYAIRLSNLGTIYSDWADVTGDVVLQAKEREYSEQSLTVTLKSRGLRHPEATLRYNNLSAMHHTAGDAALAAGMMARAVAIDLSLGQMEHPNTQRHISDLLHLWSESGQAEKAERLRGGDGSDLFPIIQQIEQEHRDWVAEDPENRHFGPPSPVTGARAEGVPVQAEQAEQIVEAMKAAGLDPEDMMRKVEAGEMTEAEVVAQVQAAVEGVRG